MRVSYHGYMNRFSRRTLWIGLAITLSALCSLLWHVALFRVPVDGLTGAGNFRDGKYHLVYTAPPDSTWTENGISLYSTITRVDARDIATWLDPSAIPQPLWETGQNHQYLVERRDGDGRRVISTELYLPSQPIAYLGLSGIIVLFTVLILGLIIRNYRLESMAIPLTLMACASVLGLAWNTFQLPFSYLALRWPFWGQIFLHMLATGLWIGTTVHIAMTFIKPLTIYKRRRRELLLFMYGFYPVGLGLLVIMTPLVADKITIGITWGDQATSIMKGLAYITWAAQYRRASLPQRGQLHWVLAALALADIPYLITAITANEMINNLQTISNLLPPLGYLIALYPGRAFRLNLRPTAGFVHAITNILITALFLISLGLISNLFLGNNRADRAQSTVITVTVVLAVLFALTTVPLANLLREQLDRWFNGTRGAQRALLHQFTGTVSAQIDLENVSKAFRQVIDQGVQPAFMALWLWDQDFQILRSPNLHDQAPEIISLEAPQRLTELTNFVPDGQLLFWSEGRHYYGAIALFASRDLAGVCAIGPRLDGGHYSGDVVRFLETLIRSATLAFRNAQLITQLEAKIIALRSAYQQLITIQETERQRLAAELHDETLQQLAHSNLLLAYLGNAVKGQKGQADAPLRELQTTILTTERRLREILRGIYPAVLTDLGLISALQSWLPRSATTNISFTARGFEGRRLTDAGLEMSLYRLTQESVNNALKHAQAAHITIHLKWESSKVELEIADDGRGFLPTQYFGTIANNRSSDTGSAHFGLFNIRERVNAFGGQLIIDSQPGQGTKIIVSLPVQE